MTDDGKQQDEEIKHPVRWLPSAWQRIQDAAEALTARRHIPTNPTDVIRTGTMRYVDEVLSTQPAEKAS